MVTCSAPEDKPKILFYVTSLAFVLIVARHILTLSLSLSPGLHDVGTELWLLRDVLLDLSHDSGCGYMPRPPILGRLLRTRLLRGKLRVCVDGNGRLHR